MRNAALATGLALGMAAAQNNYRPTLYLYRAGRNKSAAFTELAGCFDMRNLS